MCRVVLHRISFLSLIWILASILTSCGVSKSLRNRPSVNLAEVKIPERVKLSDTTYVFGNNSLYKNKQGLWELYVEGNPLELGLYTGSLTQELFKKQEHAFLSKVDEFVPSKTKQALLRKFLAWFNRKMYMHVSEEYKSEIYGLSRFASDDYNHIADKYLRVLYLHGAHDIGHALKDLALVGCSSFAVWGDKTPDGQLLLGRNFDFYAGDEFAKEKIVAFIKPSKGHKFMSVTWAGMIGVVSGMNEYGLTVTINAGKSKIPLVAKTPISLLNREILQYASNIEEAIAIAKKRKVFVSESILIGSAYDKKAIIIEVSPNNFGVYDVNNTNQLICSNHFQSDAYKDDEKNLKHMKDSHSKYRYQRLEELLNVDKKVTPQLAVDILRNKEGLQNKKIGYGNEKALNQLLAHHGIVFKPEERLVWVSSNPYQLGEFVAYDLDVVFNYKKGKNFPKSLAEQELTIEKDSFIYTKAYNNYKLYRQLKSTMQLAFKNNEVVTPTTISSFKSSNPDFWEVNAIIGSYYYEKKYYKAALNEFEDALTKEITTRTDRDKVSKFIKKLKRRLQK